MENEINDFREFLEEISPDNFDRSSAYSVTMPGYKSSAFDAFIEKHLKDAEHEYGEEGSEVSPLIWLANAKEERAFEAYHDETIQDMFDRIHREAVDMDADMTFVAMILHAANQDLDIDGTDPGAVRAAIASGDLALFYGWYAELRTNKEHERRGGLWYLEEDNQLGVRNDGNPSNAPLFHSILGG